MTVADGLVGNAGDGVLQQLLCKLGKRRQVKIGEEDKVLAQVLELAGNGFLDFDHHVRLLPNLISGGGDLGAGLFIVGVGHGRELTGGSLDQHVVTSVYQGLNARWHDANPRLVVLTLFRDADNHMRMGAQ